MDEDDANIFLEDSFHKAAWTAFALELIETGKMPESQSTRKRAYKIYEEWKRG